MVHDDTRSADALPEAPTDRIAEPLKWFLRVAAASSGMVVPAGIYRLLQGDGAARRGWGTPMATGQTRQGEHLRSISLPRDGA